MDVMSGNTGDKELDDLVNGIHRLEMKQKERNALPPPPDSGAWTFKAGSIRPAPGHLVPPEKIREPSFEYTELARRSTQTMHSSTMLAKRPKLVVLDLNNTLVARKKATSSGARNAVMRPYLSPFLEYLCGADEIDGKVQRRFNVMVHPFFILYCQAILT